MQDLSHGKKREMANDGATCGASCNHQTPKRNKAVSQFVAQTLKKVVSPLASIYPNSNNDSVVVTPKRADYLSWDAYFLAVAILSSKRSKDPDSPSGACIVDNQNRIVGIGYSGFPRGCSDDIFPWKAKADDTVNWLHTKNPYICQSVANAILNKSSDDVAGCRIYVMRFPSSECAKMIIQSRIQEVIVLGAAPNPETDDQDQDQDEDVQASQILLDMAGVDVRYFMPPFQKVELDFLSALTPVSTSLETDQSTTRKIQAEQPTKKDTTLCDERARRLLLTEAEYDPEVANDCGKRENYLSWDDYFMSMAFLTAQRSKDPNTQVGACIVDSDNRIVGLGYNGFPRFPKSRGCNDEHLPWARSNANKLHNKYVYVCHAEVNAILNKGSANVKGATIYVALFPCENCAKMIIQSGIRQVVFMSDSYHDTPGCRASRIMLGSAGVELRHYAPSPQKLTVEF